MTNSYKPVIEQLWKEKLRSVHHQLFGFSRPFCSPYLDHNISLRHHFEFFNRFDNRSETTKVIPRLHLGNFLDPYYKDVMQYTYGKVDSICSVPAFIIQRQILVVLYPEHGMKIALRYK
jgi:hypothetical protein